MRVSGAAGAAAESGCWSIRFVDCREVQGAARYFRGRIPNWLLPKPGRLTRYAALCPLASLLSSYTMVKSNQGMSPIYGAAAT
jgi:hypothetical protein